MSDPDLKVALAYGVAMQDKDIAVPAVFVIDQQKHIRFVHVGESVIDRPSAADVIEQVDLAKQ